MVREVLDVFIIGGGINGAGVARDAAGRGLSVMLVEQGDLASATSSASSKLIHGGLRYLEYYKFSLVRKALIERELLLKSAPHIIWPARFILPHAKHLRPKWLIRIGLYIYDSLNWHQKLKSSRSVNLTKEAYGNSLKPQYKAGFAYSDCRVHDSRLVLANLQDARDSGAIIGLHTKFISAKIDNKLWQIIIEDEDGQRQELQAKTLVNAAGPWVDVVNNHRLDMAVDGGTRLVTGSHIIVPKIYDGDHCYLFQNEDDRIVFAIPYEQDFTMIGTTDKVFKGDPNLVKISDEEIEYLCEISNQYFKRSIKPSDIIWSFAGVRSLFDDKAKKAASVTREYVLDLHHANDDENNPPLLSIYGGKITTFRHLSEAVCEELRPFLLHMKTSWTKNAILHGGDINQKGDIKKFIKKLEEKYGWLHKGLIVRLATHYGSKAEVILAGATEHEQLGINFGYNIFSNELDYAIQFEWVRSADDYLWRRTRLGLHVDEDVKKKIQDYVELKTL